MSKASYDRNLLGAGKGKDKDKEGDKGDKHDKHEKHDKHDRDRRERRSRSRDRDRSGTGWCEDHRRPAGVENHSILVTATPTRWKSQILLK